MAQNCIWKFVDDCEVSGYTLIIPSVAVGNVGQLACDLLISSLDMKKIGSVYSPALIPVLGYDPYNLNSCKLSTCCEIYKSSTKRLAVLQLRAPLVYRYAKSFLEEVVKVFKQKLLKDLVILTSSFAHEKKHIPTSSFRYIANELCLYKNIIKELGWLEHEHLEVSSNLEDGRHWKIYGGGFATLLYDIATENGISCLILFKYCSEGDNIPDAYDMIYQLNGAVSLLTGEKDLQSQLIQPASWKMLFGRPPPQDIY